MVPKGLPLGGAILERMRRETNDFIGWGFGLGF
jgi:hypothetical protein